MEEQSKWLESRRNAWMRSLERVGNEVVEDLEKELKKSRNLSICRIYEGNAYLK
jgi:hypothetical protein